MSEQPCPRWGTCFSTDCTCHPAPTSPAAAPDGDWSPLTDEFGEITADDVDAVHQMCGDLQGPEAFTLARLIGLGREAMSARSRLSAAETERDEAQRDRERATYAASNALDVAELDARASDLALEVERLREIINDREYEQMESLALIDRLTGERDSERKSRSAAETELARLRAKEPLSDR